MKFWLHPKSINYSPSDVRWGAWVDEGTRNNIDAVLSWDILIQKEGALKALQDTPLNLSGVRLWKTSVKVWRRVVMYPDGDMRSYEEVKDDENVISFEDFGDLDKNLWVWDDKTDFTRFCMEVWWIQEWVIYRTWTSRRWKAYVVTILDWIITCLPDANIKDRDKLPVLKKGNIEDFEIKVRCLNEMPDESYDLEKKKMQTAEDALSSMQNWEWKEDIRIEKWCVFFEELDFGIFLSDLYTQDEEEIKAKVLNRDMWKEIDDYLIEMWLNIQERLEFYINVLGLDEAWIYKTASKQGVHPICMKFLNKKMHLSGNLDDNSAAFPMREVVHQ